MNFTIMKGFHLRTQQMHKLFILLDSYSLTDLEKAVFKNLFMYFNPLIGSIYYKVATFGDGKYQLTIRRDIGDWYDIKFSVFSNNKNDFFVTD